MTHSELEAILERVEEDRRFEERAARWLQRICAGAGIYLVFLLVGELL
jgi:hypothetical protein